MELTGVWIDLTVATTTPIDHSIFGLLSLSTTTTLLQYNALSRSAYLFLSWASITDTYDDMYT